ncbi:MAG: 5-methyltetrahydropteroyltriglutamate--homocysteine S-methyltransferase, partial [Candidatus Limnocylindria bacterium]
MTPPFRADHVGSLLRPAELREARAQARTGSVSAAQLAAVEDRCIRTAVARQESIGLRAVTDGELRREFWHLDFLRRLEGVTLAPAVGMTFQAADVPPMVTITSRLRYVRPIMMDHFAFLRSATKAVAKLTIPSPSMLHLRGGRNAIAREAYPSLEEFWGDVAAA